MILTRRLRLLASLALIISMAGTLLPAAAVASEADDSAPAGTIGPGGAPPAGSGPVDISGFVRGIDGDTLETWINGSQVGIGVIGIDVFEANTVCGAQAADYFQSMLFTGFHAEEDDQIIFDDRLRRMYYVYTPDGGSIAHAMVSAGYALASGEGRDAEELAALEDEARAAGAGCVFDDDAGDIPPPPPATATISAADSSVHELLSLPSGFQAQSYVSGLNFPTDFAFLPDGRVLIAEKSGLIRIAVDGSVLSTPFIDLRNQVNDYWDRGMLSVAVDPNFNSNGYVYFLFTYEHNESDYSGTKTGRLIRVTASGDTASPASEVVILGSQVGDTCDDFPAGTDCIPSDGPSHSTGGMRFATDGTLYATLGEGANFNAATPQALRAQDLDSLGGKLIRITKTGQGLSSNPFWTGNANDVRSKIWASGFRNAYRFALRPGDDTPYVGDVGWVSWEEVNVAQSGANLGWPCYEGALQQSSYSSEPVCEQLYNAGTATPPIITWDHSTGGSAVTGGVFYTGTSYPAEYQGAYFFGDYARNFIRYAQISSGHTVTSGPTSFEDAAGGPVDFEIGPGGDLFYLSISTGNIIRVVYDQGSGGSDSDYVSNLEWASSSSGWGPVERDQSNGENGAGDGNTITINGSTFTRGLGAHASSEIVIDLDGTCSQFVSTVGVDDEVGNNGSVVFEVYSGASLLASTGVLTGADGPETLTVNLAGVSQLRLVVTDGGDNIHYDHADWADAWIECGEDQTPPTVQATSPADGETGVAASANITATFSEAIDEATLPGNVTLLDNGTPIPATVSYSTSTAVVTIDPDDSLTLDTTYVVEITGGAGGVTDLAGNSLAADVTWSFTTAASGGPVPTITSPLPDDTFIVGDEISYSGSAIDAQGDPLPKSALRWRVIIYHCNYIDCHTHQMLDETGVSGGSFSVPDHGDQYYFEIELTATDDGLNNTTSVEIHPETVDVTLQTDPAGLAVNLAGEQATAPLTRPIVVGSIVSVSTPSPQGEYVFESWSDGGARVHNVQVGTTDITLTASFTGGEPGSAVYLSDMSPVSTSNHWGPVEFDQSNGEQDAGDGGPITIDGVIYQKGLGVHSPSSVVYTIDGCMLLRASIGVDDEVGDNGTVVFEVWGNGGLLYQSPVLTGADPAANIAVDTTGIASLDLRTTDAGDNVYYDHADWGDARIECGDPPADTTPPSVTGTSPIDGATGVAVGSTVSATFSEPVDEATLASNVTLAVQGGGSVAAALSWDGAANRVTLTPGSLLDPDTTYVATILGGAGGVTDLAGNPLAFGYTWSFTTAPDTSGSVEVYISDMTWVSSSNGWGPVERDQSNGEQDIGDGNPITIGGTVYAKGIGAHAFSEIVVALDGTCTLFSAIAGIDDEVSNNGSVVFEVYSGTVLLASTGVLTGAASGQPLTTDISGVTTLRLVVTNGGDNVYYDHADWAEAKVNCGEELPADTTPPTATSVSPVDGATNVSLNPTITADFSEDLDPDTLPGNVELREQGASSLTAISTSYSTATDRLTITPDSDLSPATTYVVTIHGGPTGIRDVAGNPLAEDASWSFTTSGEASIPTVFEPPAKIAAGTNAHGVSVVDVDEDGNLDLVVATTGDDAIGILLGDGDGGFAVNGSYPTGVHPKFATTGDFNGDGDLDFAAANQDDTNGEDVSVYLGDGAGSFTLAGHFGACSNPHEVAPGDLNEDGDLDLVVACWGGSVASLLLGNGDGTFESPTDTTVGSAPHSVVVNDFNGDGNLDIATADHDSNTVSILLGEGDGTFEPGQSRSVGFGPHSMRAGDINRDGDVDLVTANDAGDTVSVLIGNGDGTFSRGDFDVGDEPKGVALGDIDGDGWLDIISANIHGTYPCCSGDTSITVLFNDQGGGFTEREDTTIVSSPFSVATGDFDEDGRLDVASANWHTNDVAIFIGNH